DPRRGRAQDRSGADLPGGDDHPEGHQPGTLAMSAEKSLKELNLQLAPVAPPVANYVNAVRAGNLLFLAGKGAAGSPPGVVGKDFTVEQAYQHARSTGLALLAVIATSS